MIPKQILKVPSSFWVAVRPMARRLYMLIVPVATLASLLFVFSSVAAAQPTDRNRMQQESPSAPYSSWDVSLIPDKQDSRKLTLQFNSPTLGRRVTNTVYVPDNYRPDGPPVPVLYYLHGSVYSQLDNHALDPVTKQETLLKEISGGGGFRQNELQQFDARENLKNAHFLTVAPDTDPKSSWCQTCGWFDGRPGPVPNVPPVTAKRVAGDSYLNRELYPLVEHLLNVRNDPGGRGVLGFSQGGTGALLQGTMHPNSYAFVGSMSGPWDVIREPVIRAIWEANGYYRDQGYGTALTNPKDWERLNPADTIDRLRNTGTKLFLSSGDGCISPGDEQASDCTTKGTAGATVNTGASVLEADLHKHLQLAQKELQSKSIPATSVTLPGVHGTNNHRVYTDYVLPEANAAFSK